MSLIILLCLPLLAYGANDLRILVVLSEDMAPYHSFAESFKQDLPANLRVSVMEPPVSYSENARQADLIVTVGIKAAESVMGKTTVPVLAVMIPSTKFVDLLEKNTRSGMISAVYIDQPWSRQVALLKAAFPERKRIGVLYSSEKAFHLQELHDELSRQGYRLIAKKMQGSETLSADLEDVLSHSDVLLAIPDSQIFNSGNIRNILLSSYQQRKPLVGLSQTYVNAGALCAVFSTPEQFAAQASEATIAFVLTRRLPAPQSPRLYSIAVNQDVARALDVSTRSADFLHLEIDKERVAR